MNNLFPFKYKILGIIFVVTAVVLSAIFFVFGSVDNSTTLNLISNSESSIPIFGSQNICSKITSILSIVGLSLIVFSKEKNEMHYLKSIRIEALISTSIAFVFWLTGSILFNNLISTSILFLNSILPFIIYLGLFYSLKKREQKKMKYQIIQKKIISTNSIIQNKNKKAK